MDAKNKSFKELAEQARKSNAYFVQGAILDFTEDVVSRMEAQGITKAELANRIGSSPAFVTKLLSGSNNFTLETMVKVSLAVEGELRVHVHPKGSICHWIDVLKGPVSSAADDAPNRFNVVKKASNEELALAA